MRALACDQTCRPNLTMESGSGIVCWDRFVDNIRLFDMMAAYWYEEIVPKEMVGMILFKLERLIKHH